MSRDIYQEVTDRFIAALEAGTVPWQKPWHVTPPQNLQSKRPYRGVNALLLSLSDYSDPRWTTFKAAKAMGGKVRKGEKATLVTFWKQLRVEDRDNPGEKVTIPLLRHYNVFNVEQVEWPEGVLPALPAGNTEDPIAASEQAWDAWTDAPPLRHAGSSAYYAPLDDAVTLPHPETFVSRSAYEATRWHEGVHATGHPSRLNRDEVVSPRFGTEPYSREELVAEIGAAMMMATLGIEHDFDNAAAYVAGWARKLASEPKLVIQAAGKAQKAIDYIQGVTFDGESKAAPAAEAVTA